MMHTMQCSTKSAESYANAILKTMAVLSFCDPNYELVLDILHFRYLTETDELRLKLILTLSKR